MTLFKTLRYLSKSKFKRAGLKLSNFVRTKGDWSMICMKYEGYDKLKT